MGDIAVGRHAQQSASNIRLGYQSDGAWNVYAGDANREEFQYVDTDGTPVDISGYVFRAQARQSSHSEDAITGVCEIVDAADGRFAVSWPGEQVRAVLGVSDNWRGLWDLEVSTPGAQEPTTMLPRRVMTAYNDIAR